MSARVFRRDDPALDLVAHAIAVARGRARLNPSARAEMIVEMGDEPGNVRADDARVALHYLAHRGVRA